MKGLNRIALLLCLALVTTAFMAIPASAASKGKLVKEHKYKVCYYEKGKWTSKGIKYNLGKFKYDKHNNLRAITYQYCKSKSKKPKTISVERYKLTYEKGKLFKRAYNYDEGYSITEYRNGVPVRFEYSGLDHHGTGEATYKARYLESDKRIDIDYEDETPHILTSRYDIQTKNGYPVKITSNNGLYSDESIVTFYTTGSKRGLLKKVAVKEYDYDEDYFVYCRSEYKCSYKMKKGLVKSYTLKVEKTYDDGHVRKYKQTGTFKYTKKKAGNTRYRSMINDIVDDGWSNIIRTYW